MKYMLDKNILTNELAENIKRRGDLCITQDVLDESGFTDQEVGKIKKAGIQVLQVSKRDLEKLGEVMATHGGNLKLINLSTVKGTADVLMIAIILSERDNSQTLFQEEYTLVTNDKELIAVAKTYTIECVSKIP